MRFGVRRAAQRRFRRRLLALCRVHLGQLELAVKAKDGDFYQVSVAESRMRDMQQELADQKKRAQDSS